jgi:hypothetical protein
MMNGEGEFMPRKRTAMTLPGSNDPTLTDHLSAEFSMLDSYRRPMPVLEKIWGRSHLISPQQRNDMNQP